MKQVISMPVVLLVSGLLAFTSCLKMAPEEKVITTPGQVINANVSSAFTYTLDLGDITSVSINKQAVHYAVSQAGVETGGAASYKYVPENNYTGSDEVELLTSKTVYSTSSGCSHQEHVTIYRSTILIKFTVIK